MPALQAGNIARIGILLAVKAGGHGSSVARRCNRDVVFKEG